MNFLPPLSLLLDAWFEYKFPLNFSIQAVYLPDDNTACHGLSIMILLTHKFLVLPEFSLIFQNTWRRMRVRSFHLVEWTAEMIVCAASSAKPGVAVIAAIVHAIARTILFLQNFNPLSTSLSMCSVLTRWKDCG